MNSNGRTQLIVTMAVVAFLAVAVYLPLQRKMLVLEREVAQLRSQLGQAEPVQPVPAAPPPVTLVQERPGLEALRNHARQPVVVPVSPRILEAKQLPAPSQRPAEPVTREVASTAPIGDQASVQLAQATDLSQEGLVALSEEELDRIVAGAGVPAPGSLATLASPPQASEDVEASVMRPSRRVEKGGVLLRKGRLQVEPTLSYSHLSSNRIDLSGFSIFDVIFIGEIRSDQIDRDVITSSLDLRYGITNSLQAELSLPSQYKREERLSGPVNSRESTTTTDVGFSDVSAGLFYHLAVEKGARPSMVSFVKVKAPTGSAPKFGSGLWGIKGGLIMMKTSDPVVLFTNLAYTLNLPGAASGVDLNPGDSMEFGAGIAYALNYNLSLNSSIEQIFIGESTAQGQSISGSRLVIANFKTGATYALSKNLSVDFSVGTGLTEDSPDLTVSVSFPYTF